MIEIVVVVVVVVVVVFGRVKLNDKMLNVLEYLLETNNHS
jgi:Sec-independent protein translocase protein TatA